MYPIVLCGIKSFLNKATLNKGISNQIQKPGAVGCLLVRIALRCLKEKSGVESLVLGGGLSMCFENLLYSSLLGTWVLKTVIHVPLSLFSIKEWSSMAFSFSKRHTIGEECLWKNL